jgi:internalin A
MRWCTFSLRALILVVLVIGAGLGWRVSRAQTQRRAVAQILAAGGTVSYDYEFNGEYPYKPGTPWGPAWLRSRIGDEYFQEVTAVSFWDDRATDDALRAVTQLDRLLEFELHGTNVTDAGLADLERASGLRIIRLEGTQITDDGLAHLRSLVGLRRLDLQGRRIKWTDYERPDVRAELKKLGHLPPAARTAELARRRGLVFTDAGLAHLARLTQLEELELSNNAITDAGLSHLAKLTSLRKLIVIGASITGSGLAHLASAKQLQEINAGASDINDTGLEYVAMLSGLRKLNLSATRVTDAGLPCLKDLKNLRELDLGATMVTDAGLAQLAGLSELQELDLSSDEITDAGLVHLQQLSRLRKLIVVQTKVGDQGVTALTGAIPKLVASNQGQTFPRAIPASALRELQAPPMLELRPEANGGGLQSARPTRSAP